MILTFINSFFLYKSDKINYIVLLVNSYSNRKKSGYFVFLDFFYQCFRLKMEEIFYNTIEQFSVELWREIFDYFNGIELWYSFRDLNKKIDSIIDRTPLYFDFKKTGNYSYFTENILPTVNIINVRSLKLSQINKTKHFFSIYSLHSMVNLRTLSLTHMFSFNDNSFVFWNQLSSLKHLQSLKIKFLDNDGRGNSTEEVEFIISSIFNKNFCPLLKSFSISTDGTGNWILPYSSLIQTTKTTNIKYFSIDKLSFTDLIKLLPALENIKSFKVYYELDLEKKSNEQLRNMTISIPLLFKCVQMHLNLADHIHFEHIEYLLKYTPNLKDLSLWSWQYHLLDEKKWRLLLSIQYPQLIKFQLGCTGYDNDDYFEKISKKFEKKCSRKPFWIERNTVVSYQGLSDDDCYDIIIRFNIKKVSLLFFI